MRLIMFTFTYLFIGVWIFSTVPRNSAFLYPDRAWQPILNDAETPMKHDDRTRLAALMDADGILKDLYNFKSPRHASPVFERRPMISTSDIYSILLDSFNDDQPVKRQPAEGSFSAMRGKRLQLPPPASSVRGNTELTWILRPVIVNPDSGAEQVRSRLGEIDQRRASGSEGADTAVAEAASELFLSRGKR